MSTINEREALEKLGVNSFREIGKEKVLNLISMIPDMEPEVAMKVLEQFPQYVTLATKAIAEYKDNIKNSLESADARLEDVLRGRLMLIERLSKILEKESVTLEETREIASIIKEFCDANDEALEKHRSFMKEMAEMAGLVVVGTIVTAVAILGGRTKI